MHAFVTGVLLWVNRLDTLDAYAEAQPQHTESLERPIKTGARTSQGLTKLFIYFRAVMQACDALHRTRPFGITERRTTADAISTQHQLQSHIRIHAVPQQVAGNGSNRIVALALRRTFV